MMAQNTVANADKKDVALELHQYVHSAMQTITNAERREAETLLENIGCSIERSRTECTATRGLDMTTYLEVISELTKNFQLQDTDQRLLISLTRTDETKRTCKELICRKNNLIVYYGKVAISKGEDGKIDFAYAMYFTGATVQPDILVVRKEKKFLGITYHESDEVVRTDRSISVHEKSCLEKYFKCIALEELKNEI